MGTMTLTGGAVLTYTSETWATAPATAYSAWCTALGVSDTGTDVAISGDDDAFLFALQDLFFFTGAGQVFYSAEGGLGLFLGVPTTTTSTQYYLTDVARWFGTESRPTVVLSYNTQDDLKSYNGKVRKSGSTTLIFAQHSLYNDEAIYRYDVAIKLTPQSLEMVGTTTDVEAPVVLTELEEDATSDIEAQHVVIQTQALGTTYRYTITTDAGPGGDPEGKASDPGPLRAAAILGTVYPMGASEAGGPLGAVAMVGELYGVATGQASAQGPLGAVAMYGDVVRNAGTISMPGILTAALMAVHDISGLVAGVTVTTYAMDLATPDGTVRAPISSWQATLQTGASNYVQCVVPAVQQWVPSLEAATAFTIYRVANTRFGVIEYAMATAPVQTLNLDRGPTNYTGTISGYSERFGDDVPTSDAYKRTLFGVRSISTGSGNIRVRCAIDWMLRPGQTAIVDNVEFVVGYINYYVTGQDAYCDVGGVQA